MFRLIPFVDLSFSWLRPDQVRWLWDHGWRGISQDLWTGGYAPATPAGDLIAPHNLQVVIDSGLPWRMHAYIVVDNRAPGGWHVNRGWGLLVGADLSRRHLWDRLELVWVDVEAPGTTFPTVRQGLERVAQLGKPERTIYTRRGFWVDEMGDSPDFRDCGFILANYDGTPDPYARFRPFASCDLRNYRGKQYQNTIDEDGVAVDLDTLIYNEEEDDDMQWPVPWFRVKGAGGPVGPPYRTYTFDGRQKTQVTSAAEEQAFLALGFITGEPKDLTMEQVKAIPSAPGTPEPDAP